MKNFKIEKDLSDSQRMRGKGIDQGRSLVLIIRHETIIKYSLQQH